MFALHLVHGMHPELFEEKVVFTSTTYCCILQLFFCFDLSHPHFICHLLLVVTLRWTIQGVVETLPAAS